MLERSCKNCKHYPVVTLRKDGTSGIPTVNDWSKRCWDCVGVSEFSGSHLALFEPRVDAPHQSLGKGEPESALGKLFKEKLGD